MSNRKKEPTPRDIYTQILNDVTFYTNKNNTDEVYAEYELEGRPEFRSVKDTKFKAVIRTAYRNITEKDEAPPFEYYLEVYKDNAILDDNCAVEIYTRIGGNENETAYFLADDKNRIIHITKEGIYTKKYVKQYKFLKRANTKAQVRPKFGNGLIEELSPHINMDRDMLILFSVVLVQCFLCTSSHFLAIISSEQGSGKSTFTNMWRNIIDPAISTKTTMPESAEELKNHLANNLVVCFDNAQPLNSIYSDILCGAVTGTSYAKRKLYTDNDEIIMNLHNIVILNGINVIPKRSDLLERCILFRLNKIPDRDRKSEAEIKEQFEKSLPYILGAVFKTLKKYFEIKDTTTVKNTHRMAGAYRECYIIATALGVEDEFAEAFKKNQQELQSGYAENNATVSAIVSYMEDITSREVKDSVSNLYAQIKEYSNKQEFPKSPSAFSRELKLQEHALKEAGYDILISKKHTNTQLTINRRTK